jgi:ribonucleoside-diphosphate reductase beta chain
VSAVDRPLRLLDPGLCLSLRPLAYPVFYDMYRAAIKNTWTVEEVDFESDVDDIKSRLDPRERHLIERLVAFFATGDSIVANNLVLCLYRHLNAPEARMYLSRQLYEEALHVQFYLTLLDTYVPDPAERQKAFAAVEHVPSIQHKARFCFRWVDSIHDLSRLETREQRRAFLRNILAFATGVEGLFFFAAFAYVYYLRSRGLLHGLATGTNWVFRDESAHIAFALEVVRTIRSEEPELFDAEFSREIRAMLSDAVEAETLFAEDILSHGLSGLSLRDMRGYLEHVADQRLAQLEQPPLYGTRNPLSFMELQDVQELTNFFERRVASYQVGVSGSVVLDGGF